ncbi:phosphoribosyl 1,2-cyclic phosphodiesterase [Paraburkholderia sp. GAS41]|jgi:pyrroloquinoline quinone biosynthesis protein B
MKIKIPGSGAGGGLPQWNCNCMNCNRARYQTGNPILDPHSPEHAVIRARGIEVARDGMQFQV